MSIPEYFETFIHVDDAVYDPESRMLSLFITILATGEKRILTQNKNDYHYKESKLGDFPDSEMYRLSENFKGKKFKWRMYDDPNLKNMTPDDIENVVHKTGEHVDGIGKILSSEDRISDRKAENLIRLQEEARRRIRKEIK